MRQTKSEQRTVRVKPFSYQPRRAELDEVVEVRKPDGTHFTMDEAAQALLRPVTVVEDPDA